jgi:hypothetical protein
MYLAHTTKWKSSFIALAAISFFGLGMAAGRVIAPEVPSANKVPLLAGAHVPAPVLSIIERACQDCHSVNTTWPWYSKVPPVSWQIQKDVAKARGFMDLSKWNQYSDSQKTGFLLAIAAATEGHLMPPARYVRMHRGARLSDADLLALQNWALAEQKSMREMRRRAQ